jgi:hypothetical protein
MSMELLPILSLELCRCNWQCLSDGIRPHPQCQLGFWIMTGDTDMSSSAVVQDIMVLFIMIKCNDNNNDRGCSGHNYDDTVATDNVKHVF